MDHTRVRASEILDRVDGSAVDFAANVFVHLGFDDGVYGVVLGHDCAGRVVGVGKNGTNRRLWHTASHAARLGSGRLGDLEEGRDRVPRRCTLSLRNNGDELATNLSYSMMPLLHCKATLTFGWRLRPLEVQFFARRCYGLGVGVSGCGRS